VLLLPESCAIINDLDVILHGFILQIICTTVLRVKQLNNLTLHVMDPTWKWNNIIIYTNFPFSFLFQSLLLFSGNVWIYRTYGHFSTDPTAGDYCHPTLYYFAFWLLNATYIIIGLSCLLCSCLGIVVACCSGKE